MSFNAPLGYTEQQLTNILTNWGEPTDRTHIYDSLYLCESDDMPDGGTDYRWWGYCGGSWGCVSKNDTSGDSECIGQAGAF